MSIWESVSDTYKEAIASALPLHRVVVIGFGFLVSLAIDHPSHLSILESVANMPLSEFGSLTAGGLARAQLRDVFGGILAAITAWTFCRATARAIFALAALSTELWPRVKEAISEANGGAEMSNVERQAALSLASTWIGESKAELRRLNAMVELTAGLGISCIVAAHWGNGIDVVVGLGLIGAGVALQSRLIKQFLTDYFGPALYRSHLMGRRPPSLAELE